MKKSVRVTKLLKFMMTLLVAGALTTATASAQRIPGSVGIGGQFGEPTGLSLKFYKPAAASGEFLAAWDFDERVFLDGHATYERHIDSEGKAHFFYGPGAFLEFFDRPNDQDDDVIAGLSGKLGLGYLFDRFEIYAHVTPRLELTPATNGHMAGGLGFRVYL